MKKTYLEFCEKGSNKFWEITLDGPKHTVRFGKIGTAGRQQTKSFKTPALAEKDAETLTRAKHKKGYAAAKPGGLGTGKNANNATKTSSESPKSTSKTATGTLEHTKGKSTAKRDMAALVDELIQLEAASSDVPIRKRKPATQQQIAALEKAWKRPLPSSYRAFLEVANGIDGLTLRLVGTEDQKWAMKQMNHFAEYWERFDASNVFPVAFPDPDDGIHNFRVFDATKRTDELPVVDWDNDQEHQRFKTFEAYLEDHIKLLKRMADDDARGGTPKYLATESPKGRGSATVDNAIPKRGPTRDAAFGAVFKLKTIEEIERATALLVAADPSADELDDYFEAAEEDILSASKTTRALAYARIGLIFDPKLKANKAFLKDRLEFCKHHLEYLRKVDAQRAAQWADLLRADLLKNDHAWDLANTYALVGRTEEALQMVERVLKGSSAEYARNKMPKDPELASIAKDPRFLKLLATNKVR